MFDLIYYFVCIVYKDFYLQSYFLLICLGVLNLIEPLHHIIKMEIEIIFPLFHNLLVFPIGKIHKICLVFFGVPLFGYHY